MKVIGYARVSTAEQASGGISLEAQEAKIRAYREPGRYWAIRMGQSASRAMGDCELRMPPDGGHAKRHRQGSAALFDQKMIRYGYGGL